MKIFSDVLKEIKPSESEKEELRAVADKTIASIERTASELGIDAHAIWVGSTARNTWIASEKDIDIFIMFPSATSRKKLERDGLRIAKEVAPKYEERYAEHPYIRAFFGEYRVDLVPCFSVAHPRNIKSAVDRTPFHNKYIKKHITGLEDEVLLLKQFMKGIGVYGAEERIQGFSGYLCELLILQHGSFLETLKKATEWRVGKEGVLVIRDPVDPNRNVAAAVSLDCLANFIDASRSFLEESSVEYFFPSPKRAMNKEELRIKLSERGTELIAIKFDAEIVDDILFPQLRKARKSIAKAVEEEGFRVFRSDVWSNGEKAVILLEMEVSRLPKVKKHIGPPVTSEYHARRFKEIHSGSDGYIKNGRYIAEIARDHTEVEYFLRNKLVACALGKNVGECIEKGYEILKNEDILFEGFDEYMRGYFSKLK